MQLYLSLLEPSLTPLPTSDAVPLTVITAPVDGPFMVAPLGGEVTERTGRILSVDLTIVTCCVAYAELPEWSVAVQLTVVVPSGNPADGASLVTVGEGSALSVTVGVPSDTFVRVPLDTVAMSAGAFMDGGSVSFKGGSAIPATWEKLSIFLFFDNWVSIIVLRSSILV